MSDLRTLIVGGSGYNVAVAEPRDDFPNHFVGDLVPTDRGWVVAANVLPGWPRLHRPRLVSLCGVVRMQ